MAKLLHDTKYFQSGDALFTPAEVASARARYSKEIIKKQHAEMNKREYKLPMGVVLKKSKMFFNSKEVMAAKRRYINKKSKQLRY